MWSYVWEPETNAQRFSLLFSTSVFEPGSLLEFGVHRRARLAGSKLWRQGLFSLSRFRSRVTGVSLSF